MPIDKGHSRGYEVRSIGSTLGYPVYDEGDNNFLITNNNPDSSNFVSSSSFLFFASYLLTPTSFTLGFLLSFQWFSALGFPSRRVLLLLPAPPPAPFILILSVSFLLQLFFPLIPTSLLSSCFSSQIFVILHFLFLRFIIILCTFVSQKLVTNTNQYNDFN